MQCVCRFRQVSRKILNRIYVSLLIFQFQLKLDSGLHLHFNPCNTVGLVLLLLLYSSYFEALFITSSLILFQDLLSWDSVAIANDDDSCAEKRRLQNGNNNRQGCLLCTLVLLLPLHFHASQNLQFFSYAAINHSPGMLLHPHTNLFADL